MNRILLPVSILVLSVPLAAQGETGIADGRRFDLKTVAKKGDAVAFVSKTHQLQSVDMGGQQFDTGYDSSQEIAIKVVDVGADGTLSVEFEIKRIRGSFDNPGGGTIEFDTAPAEKGKEHKDDNDDDGGMGMPSPAVLGGVFGEVVGKTFTAKVAGNGKVVELAGVDKAVEGALGKAGMAKMMLGGMLNESTFRNLLQSTFGPLPKEPVAVGATWDIDPVQTRGGVPTTRKLQAKLSKAEDDAAEFQVTGTVTSAADDAKGGRGAGGKEGKEGEGAAKRGDDDANPMRSAKVDNGRIAGTVAVSRKDGFVVRSETKLTMDITMAGPMGGDMKVAVTTTMTLERGKPGPADTKPPAAGK